MVNTLDLPPGVVDVFNGSPGVDCIIVGAAPQWADGSDATYARCRSTSAAHPEFSAVPQAFAQLPAMDLDPTRVISIGYRLRASDTGGDGYYGPETPYALVTLNQPTSGVPSIDAPTIYPTLDGSIGTYEGTFDPTAFGSTVLALATALSNGQSRAIVSSYASGDLFAYELTIVVTYGCSTTLRPGPVTAAAGDGVVVGALSWADGSDATYATASTVTDPSFATRNAAVARIDPTSKAPKPVTAAAVHLRASASNAAGSTGDAMFVGFSNGATFGGFEVTGHVPTDGAIHDVTIPLPTDAVAALNGLDPALASVYVGRYSGGPSDPVPGAYHVTVYELWIDAYHECPTVTMLHALRQWPRSDGLGASSARRVYPPAPSVQASNRRVGGYS